MQEPQERPPISTEPLSVVLLARNAGFGLVEVISSWMAFLDSLNRDYEIVLVDDSGSDGTAAVADALAPAFPRLRVLHHDGPQGIGASLRTGIAAAQKPLLFYTFCDKQYQPAELCRLLEAIDKVDLVIGYRVGGKLPFWLVWWDHLSRLVMRVLLGLACEPRTTQLGWEGWWRRCAARSLFGLRLKDPECAFQLFRRQIFARIPIQSDGPLGQIEILAKANFLGCWMTEVPVTCLPIKGPREDIAFSAKKTRQEAWALFHHPDFGPAFLAQEKPQEQSSIVPGPPAEGGGFS
jgi:hypothetical protein